MTAHKCVSGDRVNRILVTGAGGPAGVNFVMSLRIAPEKMFIVGTEANEHFVHLVTADRKYLVSKATEADYVDRLNEIIRKEDIEFVHPQPDIEVAVISENREKLDANVFLPSKEAVRKCQDKLESTELWQKNDVPIARVVKLRVESDIDKAFEELGSPIWIRARHGAGGRGSTPAYDKETALSWIRYWKSRKMKWEFIAQEHLPGRNIGFHSLWKDGQLVTSMARERLEYIYPTLAPSGISVGENEPVLVIQKGIMKRVNIGELYREYSKKCPVVSLTESNVVLIPKGELRALSLNRQTMKIEWRDVRSVSQHKLGSRSMFKIDASIGSVAVTEDHSLIVYDANLGRVVEKSPSELRYSIASGRFHILAPNCLNFRGYTCSFDIVKVLQNENLLATTNGGCQRIILKGDSYDRSLPKKIELTEDLARLVGYYIAEGNIKRVETREHIRFFSKDFRLISDFAGIANKLGLKPRVITDPRTNVMTVYIGSTLFSKFCKKAFEFKERGKNERRGEHKRVPLIIMNSTKPILAQFLKGYFSGDGWVRKGLSPTIHAASSSRELINDNALCLLRFGIKSTITHKKPAKNSGEMWCINIHSESKVKFIKDIGFVHEELNRYVLDKHHKRKCKSYPSLIDLIPINAILQKLKKNYGDLNSFNYFYNYKRNYRGMTRELLGRKLPSICNCITALASIKQLASSDVLFISAAGNLKVNIVKEDYCHEYVYDLSVEGNENFLAGHGAGIFVHNTGTPSVQRTIQDERVNRIGTKAVLAIDPNFNGIACADLKEDREGMPCVTEINAGRMFTTSFFFSSASKILRKDYYANIPYLYVKLAFRESIPDIPKYNILPENIYWIRHIDAPAKLVKDGKVIGEMYH